MNAFDKGLAEFTRDGNRKLVGLLIVSAIIFGVIVWFVAKG